MGQIIPTLTLLKGGTPVLIRTANERDAARLLSMGREVMAEEEFSLTQPDELDLTTEQEAAWVRGHLDSPAQLILVAEINGEVIGIINFCNGHRRRIAHTGEFGMSVAKTWRGKGIGDLLLLSLIKWAEANPAIEKIGLTVHATNARAIGLYEKHGFREEGRRLKDLKYDEGQYVDSVIMGKPLPVHPVEARLAVEFVNMLVPGRFDSARAQLSPSCEYHYSGKVLRGDAIIEAFEQSHEKAKRELDQVNYLPAWVRAIEGDTVIVGVADQLKAGGREHWYQDRLAVGIEEPSVMENAIAQSIRYLSSQAALDSIRVDPYWPKWNSPWWHMVTLHEMGLADKIPRSTAKELTRAIARQYPQDGSKSITTPCPCELGNIFQVLCSAGVDVDSELPWVRSWFMSRQMTDGGLSCDDDAYHAQPQASSIVGTIAPLEALLLYTNRSFTPKEERFLDRGARCLLERELIHGCVAEHNAEERLDEVEWLKPCFPRFYFYDVLRGLSFILRWAEKRKQRLPASAIETVVGTLNRKFPDGQVRMERHSFEGVGTRLRSENGEWARIPDATRFCLLDEISKTGQVSPWLTAQWADAQERIQKLSQQGLIA